jgi:hypothetical protein
MSHIAPPDLAGDEDQILDRLPAGERMELKRFAW